MFWILIPIVVHGFNAMNVFVIFVIAVWNLSLMTICGTLLRKYAFVVASLIIILCSILLSWTIHHFGLFLFWGDVWKDGVHYESEVGALAYVLAVLWPMCSQSCCLHLPSSTTGHHSISSSISN